MRRGHVWVRETWVDDQFVPVTDVFLSREDARAFMRYLRGDCPSEITRVVKYESAGRKSGKNGGARR